MFTSSTKREIKHSRRSRAMTAKICTEKRARVGLLFCQSKAITFLPFSLRLLKFPNGTGSQACTAY